MIFYPLFPNAAYCCYARYQCNQSTEMSHLCELMDIRTSVIPLQYVVLTWYVGSFWKEERFEKVCFGPQNKTISCDEKHLVIEL